MQKKRHQMAMRLPKELHARLREYADGRPMNVVLCRALEEFLARHAPKSQEAANADS